EYSNHPRMADLAEELRPEGSQHVREGLAIVSHGQVGRRLESPGAPADARDQHFLLVANLRIKFSFRNVRACGDLERAGRRVAILHKRREGRIKDARPHCGFVSAAFMKNGYAAT